MDFENSDREVIAFRARGSYSGIDLVKKIGHGTWSGVLAIFFISLLGLFFGGSDSVFLDAESSL